MHTILAMKWNLKAFKPTDDIWNKRGSCTTHDKGGQKYSEEFLCMMMRFKQTSSQLIMQPQTSRVDLFCQG